MSIDAINASKTVVASNVKPTAPEKNQIGTDYEQFLRLLTAQIKNQDPLKPMDSTQFISQLAELSSVEQSVKANDRLSEISNQLGGVATLADIGLVNRSVTVSSDTLQLKDGTAALSYDLEETSSNVAILLTDAGGTVVRTLAGPVSAAEERISVTWDGKDNAGNPVADGTYGIQINAQTDSGGASNYNSYAHFRVESVALSKDGSTLVLANGQVARSSEIIGVQ